MLRSYFFLQLVAMELLFMGLHWGPAPHSQRAVIQGLTHLNVSMARFTKYI